LCSGNIWEARSKYRKTDGYVYIRGFGGRAGGERGDLFFPQLWILFPFREDLSV
jgi:hypothetical protein